MKPTRRIDVHSCYDCPFLRTNAQGCFYCAVNPDLPKVSVTVKARRRPAHCWLDKADFRVVANT